MRKFLVQGPPPGPLSTSAALLFPDFEFRPVRTAAEVKKAAEIIYREYLDQEFILPHINRLRFSFYQILPTTVTFVAIYKKTNVVATLTFVEDSPLGLPMDRVFKEDLDNLRLDNRHLVEFSMLAMDKSLIGPKGLGLSQSQRVLLLWHLWRALFDYLRMETRVDVFVECCHPHHDGMYEMLGLSRLGKLKHYGGVSGNPAVARVLFINEAIQKGNEHPATRLFMRDLPPADTFKNRLRFGRSDLMEFFVEHSNILSSASTSKFQFIQSLYPEIDLYELVQKKGLLEYLIESLEQRKENYHERGK